MKLIKRIQDRIRVNREDRENRRQDRQERRSDRINTISGYIATFLFIVSIIAVLITIYQYYSNYQKAPLEIIDTQAVKYGKTIISKVNRVYDGDTINVDIKDWPPIIGKSMPVRINKIDTPEMVTKNKELKVLAVKARDYVKQKINDGKIIELRNIKRDKYFRLDADLYVDDVDIAQELLLQGLAKPYDGGKKSPWE